MTLAGTHLSIAFLLLVQGGKSPLTGIQHVAPADDKELEVTLRDGFVYHVLDESILEQEAMVSLAFHWLADVTLMLLLSSPLYF